MPTLLFQNSIPTPPLNDPAYLAGIATLINALTSGARIHVSLQFQEGSVLDTFYSDLNAMKIGLAPNSSGSTPNYASGLLPLRPPINDFAEVIQGGAIALGSVDTLGNYVYGVLGPSPITYPGYTISWWADEAAVA